MTDTPATHADAVLYPVLSSLAELMQEQIEQHGAMQSLLEQEQQAIATANLEALKEVTVRKADALAAIQELDRRRMQIVQRATAVLEPHAQAPLTLRALAGRADDERRDEILTLADRLREAITLVRRQSSIVASAADALSCHLSGLMQSMHGVLSRAGVYSRRGRVAPGSQLIASLDVKS